jgi:hypothetical protein
MLNLPQWCRTVTGIPGTDEWTCYQFDSAVRVFGTHIENKLSELDKNGKPKNKLETLLGDVPQLSTYERMKRMIQGG